MLYELKPSEVASLVVQWLRVCLAMQGVPALSLVQGDPTRQGALCTTPEPALSSP